MRDPSSYTLVDLGANASDETVFLERRVSYVTAIIQSAFSHPPESHQDSVGRELWDKLCPTPALTFQKVVHVHVHSMLAFIKGTLRRTLEFFFLKIFGIP